MAAFQQRSCKQQPERKSGKSFLYHNHGCSSPRHDKHKSCREVKLSVPEDLGFWLSGDEKNTGVSVSLNVHHLRLIGIPRRERFLKKCFLVHVFTLSSTTSPYIRPSYNDYRCQVRTSTSYSRRSFSVSQNYQHNLHETLTWPFLIPINNNIGLHLIQPVEREARLPLASTAPAISPPTQSSSSGMHFMTSSRMVLCR